jgi:protein involved in polysaccharide export with SLBB domain
MSFLFTVVIFSQLTFGGGPAEELFSDEEYALGPGDSLQILIKDLSFAFGTTIDFSGRLALVTPVFGGQTSQTPLMPVQSVSYNIVDFKQVYNLTLKDLKDSLPFWYSKYLKAKEFDVRILSPRVLSLFLTGASEYNGPVPVRASLRISNVLADTQRICTFDADISKITVITYDGKVLEVNLENYYTKGDLRDNPVLAKVKSINVPKIKRGVKILGAVKGYPVKKFKSQVLQAVAGTYLVTFDANVMMIPCDDSIRVEDALRKAGGLRSYALIDEIYSASKGKLTLQSFISSGDVLYVPPFTDKVFVAGEVKSPGFVPYLPGATLDTYLSYCGGYSTRAASHRLYVVRANKKIPKGKIGTVQPGDIIFVPEVRLKWFEDYLQLAQVITSVLITWVTLKNL